MKPAQLNHLINNMEIKVKYIPGVTRYFSRTEDVLNYGFSNPKVKPGMIKLINLLKPYVAILNYYPSSEITYQYIVNNQRIHNTVPMSEYARVVLLMSATLEEHFAQNNSLLLDLTD